MPPGVYERKPYMRNVKIGEWGDLLLANYERLKKPNLPFNSSRSGGGVAKMAKSLGVSTQSIYMSLKRARQRREKAQATSAGS